MKKGTPWRTASSPRLGEALRDAQIRGGKNRKNESFAASRKNLGLKLEKTDWSSISPMDHPAEGKPSQGSLGYPAQLSRKKKAENRQRSKMALPGVEWGDKEEEHTPDNTENRPAGENISGPSRKKKEN